MTKTPKTVFTNIPQILGRHVDDPSLSEIKHRVFYPITPIEDRDNVVGLQIDENTTVSSEFVASALLSYAKQIAEKSASTTIKDTVITVSNTSFICLK
jgi:molecular chaperone DnaK (HSP70)